ncbi:MAG: hypothetical protein UR26_C0002G0138 [candidate division TM6 bacterium GW2011_GWF2_32_72]|nr:MAG: hypothetical protein UR26_C0002G0138 [candidate division TM6 bacterium GW2011_GWF2_32_72]
MNLFVKYSPCVILFLLCSCGDPYIDEQYAVEVVKKNLSINGDVVGQKLEGGLSSARLFLVTTPLQKYVVRFLSKKRSKQENMEEINLLQIASDSGYGPKIYFSDTSLGVVIMEYLLDQKITDQDLESKQFYVELANFLKKINQGGEFKNQSGNEFEYINRKIQKNKLRSSIFLDSLNRLQEIVDTIQTTLSPYLNVCGSCHNDLHGGNVLYLGNEFKAIDYESAGKNDPFFDLATVLLCFCFDSNYEKFLIKEYLGRNPSAEEEAKLYLIKFIIMIRWAVFLLGKFTPEEESKYESIKAPQLADLLKEDLKCRFDFNIQENKLRLLKSALKSIFDNFETQEFKDAVNVLKNSESALK